MRMLLLSLLLAALPLLSAAAEGDDIREAHREAAQAYYDSYGEGMYLRGSVVQNDSPGEFEAWFLGEKWIVHQQFGSLEYYNLTSPEGVWDASNYTLPYELTPEDNPAVAVISLLADGTYLEEPHWSAFNYVGEEAGGYVFSFEPEGMIPVRVVLYADEEEPQYLQVMSTEMKLAPHDPDCYTHRNYYYYSVDEEGNFLLDRETGHDIDNDGETASFIEFVTEEVEFIDEFPELDFNFKRLPPGSKSLNLKQKVAIPVGIDRGYFMVPLTFEGSDETFRFIFDTGASTTLLTPEAADAAGLVYDLTVPTHGHGSKVDFKVGMLKTASIGEAGSEDVAPLEGFVATRIPEDNTDLLGLLEMYGAAGILGNSLLHQYVVTFDHPNAQIIVHPPQLFNPLADVHEQSIVFQLDVEDLLYTDALLNGEIAGEVVIDTGMQDDLALLRETVDYHGIELEKLDQTESMVVGGRQSFDRVLVPSFQMGPFELTDQLASLTNDDRGTLSARGLLGFVGVSMFYDTRVTLDLFGQNMFVEPPQGAMPLPEDGTAPEEDGEGGAAEDGGEADSGYDAEGEEDGSELPVDIG